MCRAKSWSSLLQGIFEWTWRYVFPHFPSKVVMTTKPHSSCVAVVCVLLVQKNHTIPHVCTAIAAPLFFTHGQAFPLLLLSPWIRGWGRIITGHWTESVLKCTGHFQGTFIPEALLGSNTSDVTCTQFKLISVSLLHQNCWYFPHAVQKYCGIVFKKFF